MSSFISFWSKWIDSMYSLKQQLTRSVSKVVKWQWSIGPITAYLDLIILICVLNNLLCMVTKPATPKACRISNWTISHNIQQVFELTPGYRYRYLHHLGLMQSRKADASHGRLRCQFFLGVVINIQTIMHYLHATLSVIMQGSLQTCTAQLDV